MVHEHIHTEATQGSVDGVITELRRGADPNARDLSGNTPLHWAARRGHAEVVRILVSLFILYFSFLLSSFALSLLSPFTQDVPFLRACMHSVHARVHMRLSAALCLRAPNLSRPSPPLCF